MTTTDAHIVDEWWTPGAAFTDEPSAKPRRVLAEGNGMVIYSDGSRKTKECTKEAFEAWRRKFGCRLNPYARK